MIDDKDFDFHPHDPSTYNWTETLFTQFYNAEEALLGYIYTLARPNLGVCHCSIMANKGLCVNPWDIDYCDAQMHLPCPESYSKFTLKNGLSLEVTKAPFDYTYSYRGEDNLCSFDLDCKGIMQPFDAHDPNENPLVQKSTDSYSKTGYAGWSSGGHMESMVHTTGEITLHGKTYKIDCVDGINKSWGPRKDWGSKGTSWLHVSTDQNFGIFLAVSMQFANKEITYGPLRFGFVVLDGKVTGVVKANVAAQRVAMHPARMIVEVTDASGREYEAVGTAISFAPWYHMNPGSVSYETLFRWECNGRIGYSSVGDFCNLNYLTAGMMDKRVV